MLFKKPWAQSFEIGPGMKFDRIVLQVKYASI